MHIGQKCRVQYPVVGTALLWHVCVVFFIQFTFGQTLPWLELETTGTKPSARWEHTSIVYGDKMVVFGGCESPGGTFSNDAYTLDLTTNTWLELTPTGTKPSGRRLHTSIVYNGKMVVFGGLDVISDRNDVWTLDLTMYAWTQLTTTWTKPTRRRGHTSVVYSGKMVVFGGIGWIQSSYSCCKMWNDAWILDLDTTSWTQLTTTGTKPSARLQHTSIVYDGKMVMFGGGIIGAFPGEKLLNDVWTLDLTTSAWTQLTTTGTKPSAREGHTSIVYAGKMVVYGVRNNVDGDVENDVWSLDLTTYAWVQLTTEGWKPAGRWWQSSIIYSGKMVMFGGGGLGSWRNDAWTLDLSPPVITTTITQTTTTTQSPVVTTTTTTTLQTTTTTLQTTTTTLQTTTTTLQTTTGMTTTAIAASSRDGQKVSPGARIITFMIFGSLIGGCCWCTCRRCCLQKSRDGRKNEIIYNTHSTICNSDGNNDDGEYSLLDNELKENDGLEGRRKSFIELSEVQASTIH
jgi:N-acetylneuraminic acid mutarotase